MHRAILPFPLSRVPDGLPGRRPYNRAATRATGAQRYRRNGRTANPYPLPLTPRPLASTFAGAILRRTSALAVGPTVAEIRFIRPRRSGLMSLSVHRGPLARRQRWGSTLWPCYQG